MFGAPKIPVSQPLVTPIPTLFSTPMPAQVLVGAGEMLAELLVFGGVLGPFEAVLVEQVLLRPVHPQVQRVRHRHAVDAVVVNDLLPGDRGEVGKVWIVLDRVAAEVRRQVGALGLEELWQLGDDRVGGDVQDVRQLAAGDQRRQFDGGVIRLWLDVDLEVDAELLVDGLPQRVGIQRSRRGAGGPRHDVDLTAAARACPGRSASAWPDS